MGVNPDFKLITTEIFCMSLLDVKPTMKNFSDAIQGLSRSQKKESQSPFQNSMILQKENVVANLSMRPSKLSMLFLKNSKRLNSSRCFKLGLTTWEKKD